jgi:hypothetical protein
LKNTNYQKLLKQDVIAPTCIPLFGSKDRRITIQGKKKQRKAKAKKKVSNTLSQRTSQHIVMHTYHPTYERGVVKSKASSRQEDEILSEK